MIATKTWKDAQYCSSFGTCKLKITVILLCSSWIGKKSKVKPKKNKKAVSNLTIKRDNKIHNSVIII